MAEKKEEKGKAAAPAAEKAAPPPADAKGHGDAAHAKKGGIGAMLTKMPVLLGGVMIIEAAVLFAGFKFLGGGVPKAAAGAELAIEAHSGEGSGESGHGDATAGPARDNKKTVEIPVLDFKAPNKLTGRTFIYDVSIYAVAKCEYEEKVKQAIKDHDASIHDHVRTIIAQMDPEKLGGGSEPGLETLRRQIKYQLDEIIGEGMIDEVLVARCIPFRADF